MCVTATDSSPIVTVLYTNTQQLSALMHGWLAGWLAGGLLACHLCLRQDACLSSCLATWLTQTFWSFHDSPLHEVTSTFGVLVIILLPHLTVPDLQTFHTVSWNLWLILCKSLASLWFNADQSYTQDVKSIDQSNCNMSALSEVMQWHCQSEKSQHFCRLS